MDNNLDRFVTDLNEFSHNEDFDKSTKIYEKGTVVKLKDIEDPVTVLERNVYYKDEYFHYKGKKEEDEKFVLFNDENIETVLKESQEVKKR